MPRRLRGARFLVVAVMGASLPLAGCAHLPLLHRAASPPPKVEAKKVEANVDATRDEMTDARDEMAANPADPRAAFRLARLYLERDSLASAESALREALRRDGTYSPALSTLSKLYFDQGRHAEAVQMLAPVLSSPESFASADREALLAGLALHQDALGHADLAHDAIAAAPNAGDAQAGSAKVFVALRGDQPDSAQTLAKAALDDDGKSAVNLNNYGITCLRAGDPVAARKAFDSAIKRDPNLPGPYYNLAILEKYYLLDDQAAARWFKEYTRRSKADPDSLARAFANAPKPAAEKGN